MIFFPLAFSVVWTKNVCITVANFKTKGRDFPGSPVVKILPFNMGGASSTLGWGVKISHVLWPKNIYIKQKQYCNKFNKDFKNGLHQKKFKLKKMGGRGRE